MRAEEDSEDSPPNHRSRHRDRRGYLDGYRYSKQLHLYQLKLLWVILQH